MKKLILWLAVIIVLMGISELFPELPEPNGNTNHHRVWPPEKDKETENVEKPVEPEEEVPDYIAEMMPYAGMPASWVSKTMMGEPDYERGRESTWLLGNWRVLDVRTDYDDMVSEIKYYNLEFAWYPTGEMFNYKYEDGKYLQMELYKPKFGKYYDGDPITEQQMNDYINQVNEQYRQEHYDGTEEEEIEYTDFWDFYEDYGDEFDSVDEAWDYYESEYES